MSRFKLLYFVIFIINLYTVSPQISDKRLCVDEECKVPISHARTLLRYSSPDSRILSFAPNVDITIYSKSAGSREDLWGGEINGKRGYVPKHLVRETKILQKPTLLVDTEFTNQTETQQVPSQVEPAKVQEPYEVVDGTTIYLSPQEDISPTSTESPIQSTALPVTETKSDEPKVVEKQPPQNEAVKDNKNAEHKDEIISENKDDPNPTSLELEKKFEDINKEEKTKDHVETTKEQELPKEEEVKVDSKTESKKEEVTVSKTETANPTPEVKEAPKIEEEEDDEADVEGENGDEDDEEDDDDEDSEELEAVIEDEAEKESQADTSQDKKEETNINNSSETVINESSVKEKSEEIPLSSADSSNQKEETNKETEESATPNTEHLEQNDNNKLEKTKEQASDIETTTLTPELEVPQPFDDGFADVTPNPLEAVTEEVKKEENTIPTLPPLGLFSNQKHDPTAENPPNSKEQEEEMAKNVEKLEEIQESQNKGDESSKEEKKEDPGFFSSIFSTAKSEEVIEENIVEEKTEEVKEPSKEDSGYFSDIFSTAKSEEEKEIEANISEENKEESKESFKEETEERGKEYPVKNEEEKKEIEANISEANKEESKESFKEETEERGKEYLVKNEEEKKEIEANISEANKEESKESSKEETEEKEDPSFGVFPTAKSEEEKKEIEANINEENKEESKESSKEVTEEKEKEDPGFLSGVFSMFSNSNKEENNEEKLEEIHQQQELTSAHVVAEEKRTENDELVSIAGQENTCDATTCPQHEEEKKMDFFTFNSDIFMYLVTTAISVVIFLFGYIAFDKCKREGPLIAKINSLEKELLILVKENQILQEKSITGCQDLVSNELVEELKRDLLEIGAKKQALEEQVQLLEKELENSTEVGMELNRMLSEILSSENGSDVLRANVESLQRQLVEQQTTINSINETLAVTNTENHELRLELELSNKKVLDLQAELDKLLLNVLKLEEEKDAQQASLESEVNNYRLRYEEAAAKLRLKEEEHAIEVKQLKNRLDQTERNLELKLKEHDILTDTIKQLKSMKSNDGSLRSLLDASSLKAEVEQLKSENERYATRLRLEEEAKASFEKRASAALEEANALRTKYDEADKLRLETETKLLVLSNYFKDREAQLQKEIAKHESLWEEKQGEATSTTERIKFMQEQLQNYKAQTESLKQEIMNQEVELKSQISVLEKKAHENWVSARQAERKLEETKQEAAQLRHRLTLRERALQDDKNQHRFQSPIEQNGDMPVSPPIESPASPPLLYGTREHITKSPPIPGLPPFLPPPPGVPFMPPPLPGVPPFIPPPPNMFPGDHRPPPLGRMSSPPLNSRYSPSSRGYSPYDRNSSSPSDSEYGTSPPQRRGYSPFNSRGEDRRDYKRAPPSRTNGRSMMKGGSSGSGNSNESLDKVNRQQSKV